MSLDAYLAGWNPEPMVEHDAMSRTPADKFAALLDSFPPNDDVLPPLWHWFHFLGWPAQHELGEDGHPANGRFLPPIPDRRRMFAGGRLSVTAPLTFDVPAERTSLVSKVETKQGRSGEMAFVTVRAEYRQAGELRLVEEQDLVYRSGDGVRREFPSTSAALEPSDAAWQSQPQISSSLLFRFSSLTANAHRIHYDEPYAREIEGYPGLVVHGPLLVLHMLELIRGGGLSVALVNYRLQQPVFLGNSFRVEGDPTGSLAVVSAGGIRNAAAEVQFH